MKTVGCPTDDWFPFTGSWERYSSWGITIRPKLEKKKKNGRRKKLLENPRVVQTVGVQCRHSFGFTQTDMWSKKGVTRSAVLMAVSWL